MWSRHSKRRHRSRYEKLLCLTSGLKIVSVLMCRTIRMYSVNCFPVRKPTSGLVWLAKWVTCWWVFSCRVVTGFVLFKGGCASLYESVSLLNHSSKTSLCSLTHLMLTRVCSMAWIMSWLSLRSLSAAKRFSCKHKHTLITRILPRDNAALTESQKRKLNFCYFHPYITETLFGFPLYSDEWNVFCFSFPLQGVYNGVQGVYLTDTHEKVP